jgi:transposase
VRNVGIDDFAFRRGCTYGTIIVDLETHQVLDLLPDRLAPTVIEWLQAHPQIEVISRDRGADYVLAATQGAPQATQVADRWHLIHNLSEFVYLFLARFSEKVRKASSLALPTPEEPSLKKQEEPSPRPVRRRKRRLKKAVLEQAKRARQIQRMDHYQCVLDLKGQGFSPAQIAARLGIGVRTIFRWLAEGIEEKSRPRRRRASPLDAFAPYLSHRWKEGCQKGARLYEELESLGYTGSIRALYSYLNRWRPPRSEQKKSPKPRSKRKRNKKKTPPPGPFDQYDAKQAAWLYLRSPDDLNTKEQKQLTFLRGVHPRLEEAYSLVQKFVTMIRKRGEGSLQEWLQQIDSSHIPEFIRFAKGLKRDSTAVQAALSLPYSNGVTEGHVHRLKLLKRQGYGRASFSLLRQRVLYQSNSIHQS